MSTPWLHRRTRGPAAVLTSLVLLLATGETATAASQPDRPPGAGSSWPAPRATLPTSAAIGAALRAVVATGIPGVLVRISDRSGVRSVAAGASDLSTGSRLDPDERFRVGSITKTFVAVVALQLVQEGRLSLDAPVGRWLPGLLTAGDTITVRELLGHTSGLYDYTDDPAYLTGVSQNRVWKPRELVALAQSHAGLFPPGTAWAYSNTDYIVVGLLVETVTGRSLGAELAQRVLTPLRLRATSFPTTSGAISGRSAHGYVPIPGGTPYDVTSLNPSAAWAAGALVSDTADLARFYQALMRGHLLGRRMLGEMTTTIDESPGDPRFQSGLGIERVQDTCGINWGHDGAIFGYEDLAYWNQTTGRTTVLATTMYPAPAGSDAAITAAVDLALCGTALPGPS